MTITIKVHEKEITSNYEDSDSEKEIIKRKVRVVSVSKSIFYSFSIF